MIWGLIGVLACTPAQLTDAGRRVQGQGDVEQALILAEVGCRALAEQRLDAILSVATGQHRLHALFARGTLAVSACETTCPPAVRARGQAALRAVEAGAVAPAQAAVARRLLVRLTPPPPPARPAPVIAAAPPSNAAPPSIAGLQRPVTPAVPPRSPWPTVAWIGAGVAAAGAVGLGWSALDHAAQAEDLAGARSAVECGGRTEAECRAAWQSTTDDARFRRNVAIGLGGAALALAATAWWLGDDPEAVSVGVGPTGISGRVRW